MSWERFILGKHRTRLQPRCAAEQRESSSAVVHVATAIPRDLAGILFVLKSGIPREMLPKEMGCGSGSICGRRLKEWQEAGVWHKLLQLLLNRLGQTDKIDWERASLDSTSVPAKRGAEDRQ